MVERIWLVDTKRWSVRAIWLADTERWSLGRIWLVDTERWSVEELWLVVRLVGPARAIWLDDPTCWSWVRPSDLIGLSNLLVMSPSEQSDWTIWLVGPGNALWLDNTEICLLAPSMDFLFRKFIQSFANKKENDTRNASCFATNKLFNLLLRVKQTKRPSL